ncbi:hypothetical protein Rhe02_12420 [Rhizocola hellebori]|uniref:HNH nuclease domain-containing protein n=2 Tax=Rhizocola hellebori TaxID=1392758 RepID=A0A8J3VE11_9ACTN|nr:hypothetical protein Rhe02_12420 [Rhizocola hellebori]
MHCDAAIVDELVASWRELSERQAVVLAKLVAVFDTTPVAEFAPFEIAAALAWTRQAAAAQLDLAMDVVRRLPDIHAAMAHGDLDLPKARVIRDGVATLDLGLARRIAATVLPVAPSLTTGQLRARLAKLVIEADPAAAAARHRARVRDRRVELQPTEDSCANVLGLNLPADAALAAVNRITAIARAVKQAGDPRSLDQIRADTFLDLLLGVTTDSTRAGGSVELVATLDTLARLANKPGHLNGYGPVIADIARQIAQQQRHTPWHFTIYDTTTGEIHTGTTRARPHTNPTPSSAASTAASSSPNTPRGGHRRHTAHPAHGPNTKHPNASRPSAASGGVFGDPGRRFPNAALARHIRARDRMCRAPGCRRPALQTDLDHTIAHRDGGRTEPGNLGPLCRFHHRAKHQGRWRLWQISPGIFVWRSPLGKLYIVGPEPP